MGQLAIDEALNNSAQSYAEEIVSTGVFAPSKGRVNVGESLCYRKTSNKALTTGLNQHLFFLFSISKICKSCGM